MIRSSLEWFIEGGNVCKYIVELSAKNKTELSGKYYIFFLIIGRVRPNYPSTANLGYEQIIIHKRNSKRTLLL